MRGASICYLNSSKKLGKSSQVCQNLHFEGKGDLCKLVGV
jgi:hypothetical protein